MKFRLKNRTLGKFIIIPNLIFIILSSLAVAQKKKFAQDRLIYQYGMNKSKYLKIISKIFPVMRKNIAGITENTIMN
jgi:hypothetical protein